MTEDLLFVLLPIFSLIVSGLIVVGLWYWWDSSEGSDVASHLGHRGDHAPGLAMDAGEKTVNDATEVLRVLRDRSTGALIVEIDGNRYCHLTQIPTPQVRQRLLDYAQALVVFSGLYEAMVPTASPLPGVGHRVKKAVQRQFGWLLRGSRKEGDPTSVEPGTPSFLLSIVDQIEDLLQARLVQSPSLADRSIHLHQAMDGGIRVTVDGESFDGIENVADDEVRSFVESVIREWEGQQ